MKNGFLQTQEELDAANASNRSFGRLPCPDPRKEWDLYHSLYHLSNAEAVLDMGCFQSAVLQNLRHVPRRVGVDLQACVPRPDIVFHQRNLCDTFLEDETFDAITCLSVIEHNVEFGPFLNEASRLLKKDGMLLVSFDYWETALPSPDPSWIPLNRSSLDALLESLGRFGFELATPFDFTVGQPVIEHCGLRYTFGFITAYKRKQRIFTRNANIDYAYPSRVQFVPTIGPGHGTATESGATDMVVPAVVGQSLAGLSTSEIVARERERVSLYQRYINPGNYWETRV